MSVNFDCDSKKENFLHKFREKLRKIGSTVDEPAGLPHTRCQLHALASLQGSSLSSWR